jgi:branched-chain amino acid transport system permease protein
VLNTAAQIILNTIISGLLLSLIAVGFTYIFRVTKVFHLAHGGVYVAGAYCFLWALSKSQSWLVAVASAVLLVTVLIYVVEKFIYLPLAKGHSTQSISLIASMGVYAVVVNTVAMFFGSENQILPNRAADAFHFDQLILTHVQIIQSVLGVTVLSATAILVRLMKWDLAFRAVADADTVAKVFGVNTELERLKVLIGGSLLVTVAAILKTLEAGVDPYAGLAPTLTAAVVTILVSRLSIPWIVAVSIALTLLQNTVEWYLNAQWKNAVTFLILLIVILFRTEGIISYNLRRDRI